MALGWLRGHNRLPIGCLATRFGVALRWLWVASPGTVGHLLDSRAGPFPEGQGPIRRGPRRPWRARFIEPSVCRAAHVHRELRVTKRQQSPLRPPCLRRACTTKPRRRTPTDASRTSGWPAVPRCSNRWKPSRHQCPSRRLKHQPFLERSRVRKPSWLRERTRRQRPNDDRRGLVAVAGTFRSAGQERPGSTCRLSRQRFGARPACSGGARRSIFGGWCFSFGQRGRNEVNRKPLARHSEKSWFDLVENEGKPSSEEWARARLLVYLTCPLTTHA